MENTLVSPPLETILTYAASSFSHEKVDEIEDAIAVLNTFQFPNLEPRLLEIIHDPVADDEAAGDMKFLGELHDCYNELFEEIGMVVESEDLGRMAEFAISLNRIPLVEDPVPFLRLMETDLANEEIIANMVSEVSTLSVEDVMEMLLEVPDAHIHQLTVLLEKFELNQPEDPTLVERTQKLVTNLRAFHDFIKKETLASRMVLSGFKEGFELATYYPYIKEMLVIDQQNPNIEQYATDLLSFFYLGIDSFTQPVAVYNKTSEGLNIPIQLTVPIQSAIIKMVNEFEQFKGVSNDTQNVSRV